MQVDLIPDNTGFASDNVLVELSRIAEGRTLATNQHLIEITTEELNQLQFEGRQ
jgi:hypothetical protein